MSVVKDHCFYNVCVALSALTMVLTSGPIIKKSKVGSAFLAAVGFRDGSFENWFTGTIQNQWLDVLIEKPSV